MGFCFSTWSSRVVKMKLGSGLDLGLFFEPGGRPRGRRMTSMVAPSLVNVDGGATDCDGGD